jgi:hypothetical protein
VFKQFCHELSRTSRLMVHTPKAFAFHWPFPTSTGTLLRKSRMTYENRLWIKRVPAPDRARSAD